MKNNRLYILFAFVLILGLVAPTGFTPAKAQVSQPPEIGQEFRRVDTYVDQVCQPGSICEDENGNRYMNHTEETRSDIQGIGDSDNFGYTVSNDTYSWINITDGTNTGLTNSYSITPAISLPFTFPFYGINYSQIYIAGGGMASFNGDGTNNQIDKIPDESYPNNFIAPYQGALNISNGQVYYKSFGNYFVIQWNNLTGPYYEESYTFQTILYSNGNIKFQYKTIQEDMGWCRIAGIENSSGTDGLVSHDWCSSPSLNGTAVLFTKPGPSARIDAFPRYMGGFTSSQAVDDFTFTIANSGELGNDTYDFNIIHAPLGGGWTAELFNADTLQQLVDSDGDGKVDTGSLAQGASMETLVRIYAPNGLVLGSYVKTFIDVTSSLNTSKTQTVTIESTVPAAFAQTYYDGSDNKIITELNWSSAQLKAVVESDIWSAGPPTIIETGEHNFVHVWSESEYDYEEYVINTVVKIAIIDKFGNIVKEPAILSSSIQGYTDYVDYISLAVTPDGKVGIAWIKSLYDSNNRENVNVWFAIVNGDGSLASGPINLTNNNVWSFWQENNYILMSDVKISASGDNRFMVSWERRVLRTGPEDVYYSILTSDGGIISPVKAMTTSTSAIGYQNHVQTALSGNRFFVSYVQWNWFNAEHTGGTTYPLFSIFDSDGTQIRSDANLDIKPDTAVQLSGGNILLANESWYRDGSIDYQILKGNNYSSIYTGQLSHPIVDRLGYGLSVTRDANNGGILTWTDYNNRYLFYAYVYGSNGALLSGPVIFHRNDNFVNIGYNGHNSITTNSWQPVSGVDLTASFGSNLYGGQPGETITVGINYANNGITVSNATELSLSLPAGISYIGDNSGITPDIQGNKIVWNLPGLGFGDNGGFQVRLALESEAEFGDRYPISLKIESSETDVNPADNNDNSEIFAGQPCYLPLVHR